MRRSILALAILFSPLASAPALSQACDPSFGGKYQELIRQIEVPEDAGAYGSCHDYGAWNGTSYKGHDGLPSGAFWTYAAPHWYIWAKRGPTRVETRQPEPPPALGSPPAPAAPGSGGQKPPSN